MVFTPKTIHTLDAQMQQNLEIEDDCMQDLKSRDGGDFGMFHLELL